MKPTKPEMKLLEKCFAAEIDAALGKGCGFVQTRGQVARALAAGGLLFLHKDQSGAFRAEGYMLTHYGREVYCANARRVSWNECEMVYVR